MPLILFKHDVRFCHADTPGWNGISVAPKGIVLDNPWDVANQAVEIFVQAAHSRAMPPGNLTAISDERTTDFLRDWYRSVQ